MAVDREQQLWAYVDYLRDMGVHDFYRRGEPVFRVAEEVAPAATVVSAAHPVSAPVVAVPAAIPEVTSKQVEKPQPGTGGFEEAYVPKPVSFNGLAPLPEVRVALADRADALRVIQEDIGDCTRCPLAYAGRRKIVFADGDPGARLMFVGEGPGADEDASGVPFVGKAGQLLNNMIVAMGLKREEVYIANIVKCRPPANRAPEPVEANTCTQFLLRQMDVVQPQVVVALGATAATYLLGVKQSLAGLRGKWHDCRGAKLAVTYHPAFLLRDPRMKGEAWKDLQMVMGELGLKAPAKG
jgi:uracil-DNA glycosylase